MITSYAQNFEDVILWRATGHIPHGFYIDIGAQDPIIDSVSMAFYEKGWRGLHIDPVEHYANLLSAQRDGEDVWQVAIGASRGTLSFHEFHQTGLSTGSDVLAEEHQRHGRPYRQTTVDMITLDDVLDAIEAQDIHWLKIDVEGMEADVMAGWKNSPMRPWVIVMECVQPGTRESMHETWEPSILEKGYQHVYSDGINRFYLSRQHQELLPAFQAPPNIFDEFQISGTASNSFSNVLRHKVFLAEVLASKAEAHGFIVRHDLDTTTQKLNFAEQQNREQQEIISALKGQLVHARSHDAHMQSHVEHMQSHVERMQNSRSWRITTPLRMALIGMRGVRSLVKQSASPDIRSVSHRVLHRAVRRMILPLTRSRALRSVVWAVTQRTGLLKAVTLRRLAHYLRNPGPTHAPPPLPAKHISKRAARLSQQLKQAINHPSK
ncbi:MAG: FkbM family methyltransferase [Halothiobacillaceae bacterium]|nr:MAG: FkbM family methyltransferase [Halothiobacillaceae bacterium]